MSDLRSMGADQFSNLVISRPTPNRPGRHIQAAQRIDRIISYAVLDHLMPVRLEQGDLGRHALVLTTRLLVEVVHNEDFHGPETLYGLSPQTCELVSAGARLVNSLRK